jgi:hypothetical protein
MLGLMRRLHRLQLQSQLQAEASTSGVVYPVVTTHGNKSGVRDFVPHSLKYISNSQILETVGNANVKAKEAIKKLGMTVLNVEKKKLVKTVMKTQMLMMESSWTKTWDKTLVILLEKSAWMTQQISKVIYRHCPVLSVMVLKTGCVLYIAIFQTPPLHKTSIVPINIPPFWN